MATILYFTAIGTDENGNIIRYSTQPPQPVKSTILHDIYIVYSYHYETILFTDSNAGVIVGAVLGYLAALALLAGLAYYLYNNDKFKSNGKSEMNATKILPGHSYRKLHFSRFSLKWIRKSSVRC